MYVGSFVVRGGGYQRRVCLSAEGEILSNDCLGFL